MIFRLRISHLHTVRAGLGKTPKPDSALEWGERAEGERTEASKPEMSKHVGRAYSQEVS